MSVLVETSLGNLVIDLYTDKCPRTSTNFLKLCKLKYYNISPFHRIEPGFTAQAGDDGSGGKSVFQLLDHRQERFIKHEFNNDLKFNERGIVAMTGLSESTTAPVNGSQFFITLGEDLEYLNGKHTIFGRVTEGRDVLDKLESVLVDEKFKPYEAIYIKHTYILHDPFKDMPGLTEPSSPLPSRSLLHESRLLQTSIPVDEDDETREARLRRKEAQAQSLTLEMLGDLPFAEIKPPENILFVAKLNPVTRSEDLETIFTRFGTILSCDVIRDKLSGKSLHYAFVEFEERQAAEEAYFKMQNVLVDDRRIYVDFSQSVSQLHHQWLDARKQGIAKRDGLYGRGLERRKQYRSQTGNRDDYDLVFEERSKRQKQ